MKIGNNTQPGNFTSELAATEYSLCNTKGWIPGLAQYYSGKTLMVKGFQGCSYEKVAKTAQAIGVLAVIFQSRQQIPGRESTYTNGKKASNISIPLLVMGSKDFDGIYNNALNQSLIAQVSIGTNPWQNFIDSPAPVVIQMLGSFFACLWILVAARGIFYSLRLQGLSHNHGMKVQLARAILYLELICNVLRLALFASDPFLISTKPKLSWATYIVLLIINVPIGFTSSVCFLFLCVLILMPSREVLVRAFFVVVTVAIFAVDITACATNASYKNPNGADIYAISFTLNGVEGLLIGIVLALCCTRLLTERNRQIVYSPRALKRLAVIGLIESLFLIIGALGSFMIAWLAPKAAWLDVFTLCVHWIGLFGVSGCQVATFPKGKRIKKIKVLKVVDDEFGRSAHPARQIVL
eukprot:Phypoly_transcript_06550.p1 GENE.Phypoly_transcript_06550~~Phypoly_transcript_06550.p1  ORF type:complete len:462 (+),score=38.17 Phypoly_transcript_06550:157-1386(+)